MVSNTKKKFEHSNLEGSWSLEKVWDTLKQPLGNKILQRLDKES